MSDAQGEVIEKALGFGMVYGVELERDVDGEESMAAAA